jgi:Right handed beta helix region
MVNHNGRRAPRRGESDGARTTWSFGLREREWLLGLGLIAVVVVSITQVTLAIRGGGPGAFGTEASTDVSASGSTIQAGVPGPPGCSSLPSACDFPDATNAGVPPGTTLTVINGHLRVARAGAVVDGKDIRGCITVTAPNVTIRRSKVTCTSGYAIRSFRGDYNGGGLVIEDVEVDCANGPATAIGSYGLVGRRLNLHNCENGFDIDSGVTVVDSYIHDMRPTDTGHTDGIQLAGGADIVIRHNTIFNPGGTSAIIGHPDKNANVTIEANLLGGGAYTLYCPRHSSKNFRVINNRFSTLFSARGGAFGPWDQCHKVAENRGNVWDSTLEPLT